MATHGSYPIDLARGRGGPDWRVRLAQERRSVKRERELGHDPWLARLLAYRKLARDPRAGLAEAERHDPEIARAERLWADAGRRAILMTLVLGRVPPAEIAEQLGVTEGVLAAAQALFFDVGDCLAAPDWIMLRVIEPCRRAGQIDLSAQLNAAYHGGPVVAQLLVDAKLPVPTEPADLLVQGEVLLHAKLRAALEFPLDEGDAVAYVKQFMEYKLAQRQQEFEREKFAHRCQEDLRRHELKRMRLARSGQAQHGPLSVVGRDEASGGKNAPVRPAGAAT